MSVLTKSLKDMGMDAELAWGYSNDRDSTIKSD